MTTIAIFGVGLIGGSLALCFKGKPDITVVGHSNRHHPQRNMCREGVVDSCDDVASRKRRKGPTLFFFAYRSEAWSIMCMSLAALQLKPGCIITDVGSTKASVAACARQAELGRMPSLSADIRWPGRSAPALKPLRSTCSRMRIYVLTPEPGTPQEAVDKLDRSAAPIPRHISYRWMRTSMTKSWGRSVICRI